jgi:hypothetical protein
MSLSAPSWSLLDTGQHLQLKGNVEFDRYTLHSYDYLNFIPLYVANGIKGSRIDMPAVEVLDALESQYFPMPTRMMNVTLRSLCYSEALVFHRCRKDFRIDFSNHQRSCLMSGRWVSTCGAP